MPVLRAAELVGAEPSVLVAVLGTAGVLRPHGSRPLAAGDEVSVRAELLGVPVLPVRVRITRLRADGMRADGRGAHGRGADGRGADGSVVFTARLAPTGAGTLLTCELRWSSPLSRIAGTLDAAVFRGSVLRALRGLVARVRETAERLATAPVVVGAVVLSDGRVLAQQRRYPIPEAGRWELPGGRVEPGETEREAVCRECVEELGISVRAGDPLGVDVALRNGSLLRVYRATPVDPHAVVTPREHRAVCWSSTHELRALDWLDADRVLVDLLSGES